MERRWFFAAGVTAALLAGGSTEASAQEANGFGRRGQLIISADRLLPLFNFTSGKITGDGPNNTRVETTDSGSSIALLWGNAGADVPAAYKVHNVPRIGVDFTVIDRLTVGGSIAVAFGLGNSHKVTTKGGNTTATQENDEPSTTVIGFAPRAGYILPLSNMFAFWPRLGFGVYSAHTSRSTSDNNNNNSISSTSTLFSLDVDPQFTLVPFEHFFFQAGPLLNIPLTGSHTITTVTGSTTTETSNSLTVWNFGITAALGGWFNL